MIRFSCLLVLVLSLPAHAATGGKAKAPFGASADSGHGGTGGAGGSHGRMARDPRNAPPLDASRKVSEQDCTKPVDFTAGNLRCK